MENPDNRLPGSASKDWEARARAAWRRIAAGVIRSETIVFPNVAGWDGPPRTILAGSFDPLHEGHRRIAELANRLTGSPVHLELSIRNVDKPPPAEDEVIRRVARCLEPPPIPVAGLLLSGLPTFADKAEHWPGAVFAVGMDTWLRIVDRAYYPDGKADEAFDTIVRAGCRFLVFGRKIGSVFVDRPGGPGVPRTDGAQEAGAPPAANPVLAISTFVPESDFREDISSTALRRSSERE
jgi:hypothetical protein